MAKHLEWLTETQSPALTRIVTRDAAEIPGLLETTDFVPRTLVQTLDTPTLVATERQSDVSDTRPYGQAPRIPGKEKCHDQHQDLKIIQPARSRLGRH